MPSSKHPTDPGYHEFNLKAGHGNTDKWRGMRTGGSSSALGPGEIRNGINIRPTVDGYKERGGTSKINTTPVTQIDGIFSLVDVGKVTP